MTATITPSAIAATIRTDELQAGDVVEHHRSGERFTVVTVTDSATDWRFHQPGAVASESGMDIVGHDSEGEPGSLHRRTVLPVVGRRTRPLKRALAVCTTPGLPGVVLTTRTSTHTGESDELPRLARA